MCCRFPTRWRSRDKHVRKRIGTLIGYLLALGAVGLTPAAVPRPSVLVVAHADTPPLTEDTLQKVYLGKIVQIDGRPVIPVNLARGSALRNDFMGQVLAQDDDKFIAYWTVRRYIGKGSPPREFASIEEQLQFIRSTPGAVGYVDPSVEVVPGLKTVLKKP